MIIRLLAVLLLLTSGYLGWWAATYAAYVWFFGALATAVIGLGILMKWRFAPICFYLLAAATCIWWLAAVLVIALTNWPHDDVASSIISLIPGAMLVSICIGGSIAIRAHFKDKPSVR